MDSLTMNRYFGDDHKPKKSFTLDDINRQAKERKKLRNLKLVNDESQIVENGQTSAVEVKKKKRKIKSESESLGHGSNDVDQVIDGDLKETEIPKKKKRKIKSESESLGHGSNDVDQVIDGDLKETEIPKKKKKLISTVVETVVKNEIKAKKKKKGKKRKKRKPKNEKIEETNGEVGTEEDKNFTLLGNDLKVKVQKVKRVLPEWLSNPEVISSNLQSKLSPIQSIPQLHQSIISLLENNGITHFFPVQSQVIPWILKNSNRSIYRPQDLCVSSPTGSGKTLAYVIPIIQAIREHVICNIKVVVVLPVRDLAIQVYKVFQTFCKNSGLNVGLAIGHNTFAVEQASLIKKGCRRYHSLVDILVCTPGRLVDHIYETPGFSLRDLRFLVIDEADRIMQHIQQGWLTHVEKCIFGQEAMDNVPMVVSRMDSMRTVPQKLLFSATLSHNPEKLQRMKLFQPKLFTAVLHSGKLKDSQTVEDASGISNDYVGKYTTPQELEELYITCSKSIKPLILLHLIHHLNYRHMVVFTNSVESTHRLCLLLASYGNINVKEISSNMHIQVRNKTLQLFAKGKVEVLVCSDAIARGIDVENVRYVISYDKPLFLKTYIHRAGRTARAGRPGTAITFLQRHEVNEFKKLLVTAKGSVLSEMTVEGGDLEPLEDDYKQALEKVAASVAEESRKRWLK